MSYRRHTRHLVVLFCSCLLVLPLWGRAKAAAAPGQYYLALGDALSYGSTAPGVPADPTCRSASTVGFVCQFYRYLREINPQIAIRNLAVPDIDSCVLINGLGPSSPCMDPVLAGQVIPSPLVAGLEFLKAHPGVVNPITLNIGGGDLLPLLPAAVADPSGTAAKLPSLIKTYQSNLDSVLGQLRAEAPAAQILVVNQYNPLGGISSPPLPAGLPAIAQAAIETGLNGVMKVEAAKYGATYVDVAGAFDHVTGGAATLTFVPATLASGDPSKIDIYPTADGYGVMTETLIASAGYRVSVHIRSAVPRTVKVGTRVVVHGRTLPFASVAVRVKLPGAGAKTLKTTSGADGGFRVHLAAGTHTGRGSARSCVAVPYVGKACTRRFVFQIEGK